MPYAVVVMNRQLQLLGIVGGVLLFTVVVETICWCQEVKSDQNHPKSLVALPFASNVNYRSVHGTTQLTYRVKVAYPAEDALNMISEHLRQEGWKQLKQDLWNPSIPSSHVRGWQQFEDDTTKPQTTVNKWQAQWV